MCMGDAIIVLGDEAIAQGALDAGISGAYAYPGTPSTEILTYIQQSKKAQEQNIHREWSSNEKTAFEEAMGMSYAGKRALVCMKHVGLNVAADPFVNAAITGVHGGVVLVVADDPSMHSSQNEQDSRFYADFAHLMLLEPSNQQEAYDMVKYGFDISEKTKLPVVMRITTRLAHSRADIVTGQSREQNTLDVSLDNKQFILLPANARRNYSALLEKQTILEDIAAEASFNQVKSGIDTTIGIVTTGIAYNYLQEGFRELPCPYPVFKITQYPFQKKDLVVFVEQCDRLLVLEEGAPFIEERLNGWLSSTCSVSGRLDGTLPRTGELLPDIVLKALGREVLQPYVAPSIVVPRPPSLCKGCPHIDTYECINDVMKNFPAGRVFADIGCYTLGALPPFQAIHTCLDMGASITMAKGAADAGVHPALAVIGDSTFTHSGMTGLLDAVYENASITVLVLDNDTTAMTGGQTSLGAGKLEKIILGLGVEQEHMHVVVPLKKNHDANKKILEEEIAYDGVSVIIARRPCIQIKRSV